MTSAESSPSDSALDGLDIRSFDGPLDLLHYLMERHRYNWYDIPISEITGQYLDYMKKMEALDMDLASDFLVMAATLIHIKSRMLLPTGRLDHGEGEEDPREELILQLLEYRRCKLIAAELTQRRETYSGVLLKLPSLPEDLGLTRKLPKADDSVDILKFQRAVDGIVKRNGERFQNLSERMTYLLKRENVSLPGKIRQIWQVVKRRGRIWFNEIFGAKSSRTEIVTGFLALLELIGKQYVRAHQVDAFSPIAIEFVPEKNDDESFFSRELLNETAKDYN